MGKRGVRPKLLFTVMTLEGLKADFLAVAPIIGIIGIAGAEANNITFGGTS